MFDTISEMIRFCFLFFKWLWACFVTSHSYTKVQRDNIMLISEKGYEARDNGYHFFMYVKKHHPEINAFYIITDDSFDRDRLSMYNDSLVNYGSLESCKLFWRAKYLVSTHQRAGHTPIPFALLKYLNRMFNIYKGKKVIFLQHGITKDYIPRMSYKNTRYDLFICGAKPEYEYMISAYGYPPTKAQYTGFCRYDNLMHNQAKPQILVMPTWRKYLEGLSEKEFYKSEYYNTYLNFLTDSRLFNLLEQYQFDLLFFPHHMVQRYAPNFMTYFSSNKRIRVCRQSDYDVQQLLKESAILVTDYSSVFFDFAYMKKKIIFFHFDYQEYRKGHFQPGYFDYNDSFGPIVQNVDSLLAYIEAYVKSGSEMEEHYKSHVDWFFPIRDSNNCKRVYDAIMQI